MEVQAPHGLGDHSEVSGGEMLSLKRFGASRFGHFNH
jgi:hypothetical protein